MKQKDIKKYSNDELREIVGNINRRQLEKLPEELITFINTEKPNGNEQTRTWRILGLIEKEVYTRFMYKDMIQNNAVSWIEGRIAELQEERNTHQLLYDKSNGAALLLTVLLTKDAKLKGYKEVLAYMLSHNVE